MSYTSYTLGQAAQATGKSKMTIQRGIKKGTISAIKSENGEWKIEPAELHRVFPMVTANDNTERHISRETQNKNIRQIEQQSERERQLLQNTIDDLRRRLDQSEEERRKTQNQLTALLTDQRQKATPPPEKSLWQRLLAW